MNDAINALAFFAFVGFGLFIYFLIGSAAYDAIKRNRPRRPLTAQEQKEPDLKAVKILREGRYRNSTVERNWQAYDQWWRGKSNYGWAPWHRMPRMPSQERNGENLAGARLHYSDISGMELLEAHLPGTNFSHAKLQDTNFRWSNLENADFSFADLTGANLNQTSCRSANFSHAILTDATFDLASLVDAKFDSADLTDVDLTNSVTSGRTSFHGATLTGAKMSQRMIESPEPTKRRKATQPRRRRTGY